MSRGRRIHRGKPLETSTERQFVWNSEIQRHVWAVDSDVSNLTKVSFESLLALQALLGLKQVPKSQLEPGLVAD
jgi:hypothetical protein